GFRCGGKIPAISERKFRLEHHAKLIGCLEVFLRRSPTVMANIVETVLACDREAAAEFALVRRRANGVRKDAVLAVPTEKNGLPVEEKFSAGNLELAHPEAD